LEAAGWTVLRFWEHDAVELVVEQVVRALRRGIEPAETT
jgi:very-short-patch-repair endonuclease